MGNKTIVSEPWTPWSGGGHGKIMWGREHPDAERCFSGVRECANSWPAEAGHRLAGRQRLTNHIRDVLLVVKGVLYLVDLWIVETGLEHDEPGVPKDIR